jgi:aryl-alcohol dehydrogenase-like predicted oxidoreductase
LQTRFQEGDVRNRFFAGDRLARTVERVERIRTVVGDREPDLPVAALKFALLPATVSTVIPGIRSIMQAERNMAVSSLPPMAADLAFELREHQWRRGFWYSGK